MAEAGRTHHCLIVYLMVKVNPDGEAARAAARQALAKWLLWAEVQLTPLGIEAKAAAFIQAHGSQGVAQHMPDEWLDEYIRYLMPRLKEKG